ncbi:MAG: ABC transporter ATP-binding protein [Treponema sp.]|jgi:peptide/nickel transport system ATP-binding protein|nr:ABC transporter ATP-binding protein [Treponema sp.]
MSALLEVQNLKKYFKTPNGMLHAVDDVSFSIDQGKTLGVVGESGCGKSTLGRLVIRLLDSTGGKIFFEGTDISGQKYDNKIKRKMQIIFQDPYSSLNPRMTVRETITEPMIIHNMYSSKKEILEKLSEIMDTVGLASRFENSYPHELDGGRRQRIGIARALVLDPKFIVCDEPVSALDVSIQAQILNLMQDLQEAKGYTYMFITHNLSVVKHISNNIMVMYLGMIAEISGSDEIFERTLHPYSKALLAAIPEPVIHSARSRTLLRGELTSPIEPKPGCRFASRCDYARKECFAEYPRLEEILPSHFAACHCVREINGL